MDAVAADLDAAAAGGAGRRAVDAELADLVAIARRGGPHLARDLGEVGPREKVVGGLAASRQRRRFALVDDGCIVLAIAAPMSLADRGSSVCRTGGRRCRVPGPRRTSRGPSRRAGGAPRGCPSRRAPRSTAGARRRSGSRCGGRRSRASISSRAIGQGSPRSHSPHSRHSRASSSGMSMATRSAPQMIALATCSAWAIPPEAISVTSSRDALLDQRAVDVAQHVADVPPRMSPSSTAAEGWARAFHGRGVSNTRWITSAPARPIRRRARRPPAWPARGWPRSARDASASAPPGAP